MTNVLNIRLCQVNVMCPIRINFFPLQHKNNMSKSTPINQLQPTISNIDVNDINEKNNDIVDDDDTTIQEVLNSISSSDNNKKQQQLPIFDSNEKNADLLEQHRQLLQANEILKQMNEQKPDNTQVNATLDNLIMNSNQTQSIIKDSIVNFAQDIKNAIVIFFVVIIIHFIPLHKYIARYFTIEKIPYHVIILRALMAVFFFIAINKFVLNKYT